MGSGIGPRIYGVDQIAIKFDLANKSTYSGSGNTAISTNKDVLKVSNITYTNAGGSSYFSFNGAGIVTSTSTVQISGTNSRTMSAWVYITSAANQAIMSFGTNGTGTGFSLETTATVWKLGYGNSGTATTITYSTNTWQNVVYIGEYASSTSMTLKLYINGVMKHSAVVTSLNTADSTLKLGTDPSSTLKFNGYISSATCYKKALSDKEILSNYNSKKSRYGL